MKKSELKKIKREEVLGMITDLLKSNDEDVLRVSSNKIAYPCVIGEDDEYVTITVQIPNGSRDGEPYDAYEQAEQYAEKEKEKAEKAKEREEKKRKKLEEAKAKKAKKNVSRETSKEEGSAS